MKKKIIGISVVLLLMTTAVISIAGNEKIIKSTSLGEVIDQRQELDDECLYISNFEWQEFVPTKDNLVRVEVRIVQWYSDSPDLRLTIEKPLGTILTSKDESASNIPSAPCDWVSFNVPDITLIPGENYFIKLTAPVGSEYGWGIRWGNPYPKGDSSNPPGDWCFRTFAEVENLPPSKPFITGQSSGNAGTEYEYKFKSTDPDGDDIYYCIDWDDGTEEICIGPYASGFEATAKHTWNSQGDYNLKAKAKDTNDLESDWTTFTVTMPKLKTITIFHLILEQHPWLFPILRLILNL
jgi:hypothetical protein